MAMEKLTDIVRTLIKVGKDADTPVAIIQDASLPNQKILVGRLGNILTKLMNYSVKTPAIIIIGEVVGLENKFDWLRIDRKILFTGLSHERFFIEGVYFHLPLIKIEPLEDYREFDNYLRKINVFDWIVFASRYGVKYFFERLKTIGLDARALSGINIAAIGESTKNKLLDFGIRADLVPKDESSKGLLNRFKKEVLKGRSVFLPRSDISDKGLEKGLRRLGARPTTSSAYRNVMPPDLPDLDLNFFDEIMFTSPSTVRNFKKRYKKLPKKVKVRCIGDITLREARKCRLLGSED
jgi:uroporphyrinogen III methyltransferase/synthase